MLILILKLNRMVISATTGSIFWDIKSKRGFCYTQKVVGFWKHWKYKNLILLGISIIVAVSLSGYEPLHKFLLGLGNLGYIGAFVAGILFVSTFTAATGAVILFVLTERLSPLEIGIIAGFGAMVGDFTIFKFVKDNLLEELRDIYNHVDHDDHLKKVFHSKYFSWTFPVFGAIIIASPLPDELGVSLIGISKMKTYNFLLLSFILNALGIFLVISVSLILKP